jgi:hypothetical protein
MDIVGATVRHSEKGPSCKISGLRGTLTERPFCRLANVGTLLYRNRHRMRSLKRGNHDGILCMDPRT